MTSLDELYAGLKNQIKDGLYRQAVESAREILNALEPGQNDEMACSAWASLLNGLEKMSREDEIDECIGKYPGGKFSRCIPFLAAFKQQIQDCLIQTIGIHEEETVPDGVNLLSDIL